MQKRLIKILEMYHRDEIDIDSTLFKLNEIYAK
jgi:hypothetical protein